MADNLPLCFLPSARIVRVMATRAETTARLAASAGEKPMTVERRMRCLSDAGMVPKSGVGQGGPPAQLLAAHFANYIMALAGDQPSDGPDAVTKLSGCRLKDGSQTFGDYLTAEISYGATAEGAAQLRRDIASRIKNGVTQRDITMCINPPYAWVSELNENKTARVLKQFYPAYTWTEEASRLRLTTIKLDLLQVAAELLADNLSKRPTTTPLPKPSPGRLGKGDATPEKMKAAGPGSHGDLLTTPAIAQTKPLNKAKSTAAGGRKQLASPRS